MFIFLTLINPILSTYIFSVQILSNLIISKQFISNQKLLYFLENLSKIFFFFFKPSNQILLFLFSFTPFFPSSPLDSLSLSPHRNVISFLFIVHPFSTIQMRKLTKPDLDIFKILSSKLIFEIV